ncbi:hypothetical protein DER29_5958 [Micromonospora sp. M71_S20]|uniref:hypothetical protein n=1 Tax=Micromonospora sp. M71_S20 TaxID=592872 RepID=UPI000F1FF581|nr:hypothetical protein [Micromonospora sp. M71_S20]RLK12674.1 hypothetical protein DER29_5958 [Micromonospora sp. M71_S20]
MSALTAPTMALPTTTPAVHRTSQVLTMLDDARHRMADVINHLELCDHRPAWPTSGVYDLTTAVELRTATVALIAYARRHHCTDCNPGRMRATLRLAAMLLDLWQHGKHYVQRPHLYPLTLAHRTHRLINDTAGWTITGNPARLLGQRD